MALGHREFQRIADEIALYRRYEGDLNAWTDYTKPAELDYEPTQISLNYVRKLVDTIAAWQFEKEPKVSVPPDILDDPASMMKPGYTPSTAQQTENTRAKAKERLLTWVWDDNRMHEKLLSAAKDRAISKTGVYARLHYDTRRGSIRVLFHPSTEVIAVHNEWDVDELSAVHFIAYLDDESTRLWKLSYRLEWVGTEEDGYYDCSIEESIYDEELAVTEERTPKKSMGLDFIPVVHIPTEKLTGTTLGFSELEKVAEVNDEIDRKMSDYSDALRFEMFAITLLMNVNEDPNNPLKYSPAAKWNLGETDKDIGDPNAKRLESGFKFKEAIESYLDRMYKAMQEISEVPIMNSAEMKTGGINDMALQLLFASIISKTQRSWITWQSRLQSLNELTLRYMKARQDHPKFKYDKEWLSQVDGYYDNEIIFGLPLPQDQKALVEQLSEELASSIESIQGAIVRSGKGNAEAKLMEIIAERNLMRTQEDPYSNGEPSTEVNE